MSATPLRLLKPIAITNAMLSSYNVPEPATGADPDPAAYNPLTVYADGDRVHVASAHMIYESVQGSNSGHDPVTDTTNTWWAPVSATNRWRMFDQKNTSQTTRTGGIDVTLTPAELYNGVAILNAENVVNVQLTMTDPVDGVVHDLNYGMQEPPTEGDYYAYCFDPIVIADTLLVTNLPNYRSAALRVQMNTANPTDVAACGVLTVGPVKSIGQGVKTGVRLGIQDYSRKEKNAYGDYTVVERSYAKRSSLDTWVPRAQVDSVFKLLASVRATPCVWIVSDYYKSLVIYGFFNDFEETISYYDVTALNISLEGLT